MLTDLSPEYKDTDSGRQAEEIIRKCVHCGFCTATCPTYQLLGDERDSPRGRIYMIKSLLEGNDVSEQSRFHLDRCLTCRACETVCPSGVEYGKLVDIGRQELKRTLPRRTLSQRVMRNLLHATIPYPQRIQFFVRLGQVCRDFLPKKIKAKIPPARTLPAAPQSAFARKVILVEGCVQQGLTPLTNALTKQILARLEIECITVQQESCCGALSQHLDFEEQSKRFMQNNIDAWMPFVEQGVEAIISTASGCGSMIKEYAHHLKFEAPYESKAQKVSGMCRDIGEYLSEQDLSRFTVNTPAKKIAFHSPCSLQHGQKLAGQTEKLLSLLGYELVPVKDSHLCCGSAGTYSILQPELSDELRQNKLNNLLAHQPDCIVTANIGCQLHLQETANVPVRHWVELLEEHNDAR